MLYAFCCAGWQEGGTPRAAPKWLLKDRACAAIAQDAEGMEEAGRWMLEDALDGGELTDMEFVLDSGRRVRGHKIWLMGRCEYVRRMLLSGMREGRTGAILVRECSDGAFMALHEFLESTRGVLVVVCALGRTGLSSGG